MTPRGNEGKTDVIWRTLTPKWNKDLQVRACV
jgi:hypothetical protein